LCLEFSTVIHRAGVKITWIEKELENWQDDIERILINKPKEPTNRLLKIMAYHSESNLTFYLSDLNLNITRVVRKQLRNSNHRPVFLTVQNKFGKERSTLSLWGITRRQTGQCHAKMQNEITISAKRYGARPVVDSQAGAV
jgi:hypothetical protein